MRKVLVLFAFIMMFTAGLSGCGGGGGSSGGAGGGLAGKVK